LQPCFASKQGRGVTKQPCFVTDPPFSDPEKPAFASDKPVFCSKTATSRLPQGFAASPQVGELAQRAIAIIPLPERLPTPSPISAARPANPTAKPS